MTKIDIFSGFLGAGKTTLIKKLIKEAYAGEKVVLIENEFGEIGIDGGFLADAGIEITEMNSGCICCSLVGDFSKALVKVLEEYNPDRIIIEPSGVGKLSDVIRAAKTAEEHGAVLNCFTTVADVNKCKMYMKNFGEFYNDQIANASAIVLSHTQTARDEKIAECVALLRQHNANAVIVTTPWDSLDGKDILAAMEHKDTLEDAVKALEEEHKHHHHHHHDEECTCGCHGHHDHDEHEHHHHHDEECSCGCHGHHDHDEHEHHHQH
ncbi:MAG: GTP-binding protein, partial [Clostridia bacterium]|nr:GTP-binding protein [Clostridia bacterium]